MELIQVPLQESFFSYLYLASPEVIPGLQKSMESPVKYFLRHKYMLHSLENLAQPGRQPESVFRLFFFLFWLAWLNSISFIYLYKVLLWQNGEDTHRDVKYLFSSSPSSVSCWHSTLRKALEPIHVHPWLGVNPLPVHSCIPHRWCSGDAVLQSYKQILGMSCMLLIYTWISASVFMPVCLNMKCRQMNVVLTKVPHP